MSLVIKMFTAPWCGPCKMMKPIVEEFAAENGIELQNINVDAVPEAVSQYGVRGVPTTIYLEHGKEVSRVVGSVQKSQLKEKLKI